jgi:hypothetical protein
MDKMTNPTIDKYGRKIWRNVIGAYHRVDGPAIEWPNGGKTWYKNGQISREDGPAHEWPDGSQMWYRNGKEIH